MLHYMMRYNFKCYQLSIPYWVMPPYMVYTNSIPNIISSQQCTCVHVYSTLLQPLSGYEHFGINFSYQSLGPTLTWTWSILSLLFLAGLRTPGESVS